MFRNNQKECQNEIDPKLSSDIVRYSPLGLFWPEKSLVGSGWPNTKGYIRPSPSKVKNGK